MHAYDLTLTLKFKDIHASMDVLAEESSRLLRKPDLFIYLFIYCIGVVNPNDLLRIFVKVEQIVILIKRTIKIHEMLCMLIKKNKLWKPASPFIRN